MVLGLGGLSNAWRAAGNLWLVPSVVAELLAMLATAVWALCLLTLAWKWLRARAAALVELEDPTQGAFVALVPMSTLVVSLVWKDSWPRFASSVLVVGLGLQVAVGVSCVAGFWRTARPPEAITPILLMPTVGACFVSAAAAGAFGVPALGLLFFGAGFISWLVTESVVLQRLMSHTLPANLRATLGIHLTPAAIASVAYLSVTRDPPDHFAQMLFGYALLQGLVLLRLVPWLREQHFAPSAWAYTFGVSALSLAAIRFSERGQAGPIAAMALPLFVFANVVIGWIALRTLLLLVRGRLLPDLRTPEPAGLRRIRRTRTTESAELS